MDSRNDIAKEIINLAECEILLNMRFMSCALNKLETVFSSLPLATDGRSLFCSPDYIIKLYKENVHIFARKYIHLCLHCVFNHMFIGEVNGSAWDTACDIAIESIINEWGLGIFSTGVEEKQAKILSSLGYDGIMTAERIYFYLTENNFSDERLAEIRKPFFADIHDLWYRQTGGGDGSSPTEQTGDEDNLREEWKKISEQIQTDLETFSKEMGDKSESMIQNLSELTREKYDYSSFLRKFAVIGEKMVVNDDEFDYNFYTYGFSLYENMPLIEQLEYKEIKNIREFVIAIDTSGSVCGEEVMSFVRKTYNILSQQENFFRKINVHIIQCDSEIKEDFRITSQEDFEEYIKAMKLHGFGGTDFRPVFDYVDRLIQEKEFTNLKGMIYFTDGAGIYPKKKPPYETAFVFVNDDERKTPDVPPWAMKLVFRRKEIF